MSRSRFEAIKAFWQRSKCGGPTRWLSEEMGDVPGSYCLSIDGLTRGKRANFGWPGWEGSGRTRGNQRAVKPPSTTRMWPVI
jgi:hypothetical protein